MSPLHCVPLSTPISYYHALGELQPRDGVDGLRRVRPALLRGAQPGTRAGYLQQGESQGHRGQRGGTGRWDG